MRGNITRVVRRYSQGALVTALGLRLAPVDLSYEQKGRVRAAVAALIAATPPFELPLDAYASDAKTPIGSAEELTPCSP